MKRLVWTKISSDQKGQASIEYALVALFLLLAIVATVFSTGGNLRSIFTYAGTSMTTNGVANMRMAGNELNAISNMFGSYVAVHLPQSTLYQQALWVNALNTGQITRADMYFAANAGFMVGMGDATDWNDAYQQMGGDPNNFAMLSALAQEMGWAGVTR